MTIRPYPEPDHATAILPRHANEPSTSWWLDGEHFYATAKDRAPVMRGSRLGQLQKVSSSEPGE